MRAGRPWPMTNGSTPRARHSGLVLVLGVAEDEDPVAEVDHPQQERLAGGGLAAAGFAEADHVRVGHRHAAVEDPAERVGVERSAGQHVDAHLGAGRRQAGGGDERPEHGRLVGGHPPRRHRRRRRRPAPSRDGSPRPAVPAGTTAPFPGGAGRRLSGAGRGRSRASRRATSRPPRPRVRFMRHRPGSGTPRAGGWRRRTPRPGPGRAAAGRTRPPGWRRRAGVPYSAIGAVRGTVTVATA